MIDNELPGEQLPIRTDINNRVMINVCPVSKKVDYHEFSSPWAYKDALSDIGYSFPGLGAHVIQSVMNRYNLSFPEAYEYSMIGITQPDSSYGMILVGKDWIDPPLPAKIYE